MARLLATPQDLLATIVLGNSFANASIVGIMFWMVLDPDRGLVATHRSLAASMLLLLLLLLLGGEVAPKTLAVRAPEFWALRVAGPMLVFLNVTRPWHRFAQALTNFTLRGLAPPPTTVAGLSDAEYHELLEMAYQQGALAAGEKEIILQIISLDRRQVREVMKPRLLMACLSDNASSEEMIAFARKHKHRRLPIYDETPDTIVGMLNTRALLLDPQGDIANAIEFPSFVPESMNLLQLLKSLQRAHGGMAIAVDEFGSVAGIVTLEDILAEVIGPLRVLPEAERPVLEWVGVGRWRVSGSLRLDNFRREYPALAEMAGVDTIGGLLLHQLEVAPSPGDSVVYGGLRFTVQSADPRRAREVVVEVAKRK